MNKNYLRKLFNVAMFSNNLPNYDKIRNIDPQLFDKFKPKITIDAGFAHFIRTRFAGAWLAKQRVERFNITSSDGNITIDGMNGSTYTRSQDKIFDVLWNELPKLISTYQNTLHGKERVKFNYCRGPKKTIFIDFIEISITNIHKHGQTKRWSNEYHISFHNPSVRKCDYEEYKRVFDVIAGAIEMSGLKLASKYFDPTQDNEIRFDINEEYFPSIPSIETSLLAEIKNINEEIDTLNARKDELTAAYNGLKKVKQLYRGGKL